MNNRDYQVHNERFDLRYSRLVRAGFKKHVFTGDVGYSRPFEVHGLVGKRSSFVPLFISNSDIMWKPFEAFDTDIQNILGE